jgi:N-methylhydantoinase B
MVGSEAGGAPGGEEDVDSDAAVHHLAPVTATGAIRAGVPAAPHTDAITLAVIEGTLESAVREMRAVLVRSGRSPIIAIATDFSNAIFDAHGEQVAQGDDQPVHLGSMAVAMRKVMERFGDDVFPGDLIYVNDPLFGGGHLADMAMFKPVFIDGELIAWAGNRIHASDAGGSVAGGFNPQAREIYAEGLRIPPIKLWDRGTPRTDVIELILLNLRTAEAHRGDMGAQIGAVGAAERRIKALCDRVGVEAVRSGMGELLDRGERLARAVFSASINGTSSGSGWFEDPDGNGLLEVGCTVVGVDGRVSVSLSGPAQVGRYVNSYFGNSLSGVYAGILTVMPRDMPHNGGVYRCVDVDLGPEGTIVNAVEPAPCSMATAQVFDAIMESVEAALAKDVPRRAVAGWAHFCGLGFSGVDSRSGDRFSYVSTMAAIGGAGAMWDTDGWSCCSPQCAGGGSRAGNVEEIELRVPLRIGRFELLPDSEGPGQWRGGFGVAFEVEVVEDDCTVGHIGDGFIAPPPGRVGAEGWDDAQRVFHREIRFLDGRAQELAPHSVFQLHRGEVLASASPGGGGIGDPGKRCREAVSADIENGLISPERAELIYGWVAPRD